MTLGVWIIACVGALLAWHHDGRNREALDGLIERVAYPISAPEAARVRQLHAALGAEVKAGAPLMTLEADDLDEALAVAHAERAAAEAELDRAEAEAAARLRAVERAAVEAEARLAEARGERAERRASLRASKAALEGVERAVEAGLTPDAQRARLIIERAALEGGSREDSKAVRARQASAEAWAAEVEARKASEAALAPLRAAVEVHARRARALEGRRARRVLRAPVDGVVTAIHLREGASAGPDAPALTLTARGAEHALAYLPAPGLRRGLEGQRAEILSLDPSGARWGGSITWIAPEISALPERLWAAPSAPRYGRLIRLKLDDPAALSGERVTVRLEGS